ncbi:hypothetical protein [Arthrobacter silvisoli]|uniref:hypothetical protein n=1 Tax=Arthrobacter silvisoli TaxID=2291022 RepID=UPI001443E2B7|nr:hypothetical protein [Arthrobacter silvisoli]
MSSGPGYNTAWLAKAPESWNRVELLRWNSEAISLVALTSDYDRENITFPVSDLDAMIDLLQHAKTALADLNKDPGAAASSPAAVAPVIPQA